MTQTAQGTRQSRWEQRLHRCTARVAHGLWLWRGGRGAAAGGAGYGRAARVPPGQGGYSGCHQVSQLNIRVLVGWNLEVSPWADGPARRTKSTQSPQDGPSVLRERHGGRVALALLGQWDTRAAIKPWVSPLVGQVILGHRRQAEPGPAGWSPAQARQ